MWLGKFLTTWLKNFFLCLGDRRTMYEGHISWTKNKWSEVELKHISMERFWHIFSKVFGIVLWKGLWFVIGTFFRFECSSFWGHVVWVLVRKILRFKPILRVECFPYRGQVLSMSEGQVTFLIWGPSLVPIKAEF